VKKPDYTVPYSEWDVVCMKCGKRGKVLDFPEKFCTRCGHTIFLHGDGFQKRLR